MTNNKRNWLVTYWDQNQARRVALQWGLNEDEAQHWQAVAADCGFPQPRAERADERKDDAHNR
jgi:hypothetical protein